MLEPHVQEWVVRIQRRGIVFGEERDVYRLVKRPKMVAYRQDGHQRSEQEKQMADRR